MSIKLKLILPFVLGIFIVFLVINFIWIPQHKIKIIKNITKTETAYLSLLGEAVVPDILSLDLANLHANLVQILEKRKVIWKNLTFIDSEGVQLFPINKIHEIKDTNLKWIKVPLYFESNYLGTFKVSINIKQLISEDLKDIKFLELMVYTILIAFSMMSFLLQYIFISKPIQETSNAVTEIAKGYYEQPLPKTSNDEIGLFITSFKKMIHSLKDREYHLRNFKKAINESGHSISITDTQGYIKYINKSFIEETGYKETDIIGKNITYFNSQEENSKQIQDMWYALSKGKQWKKEMINKNIHGNTYDVNQSVSPIFDEEQNIEGYVFVQIDITNQKELTRQLELQTQKAIESNKAKSEFIANMSHEIRTPLNAVIGYSEILAPEIHDKENKKIIESIKIAGNNLLQLINDILDLSKIEAGMLSLSKDPVSFKSLAKELECVFAQSAISKGLDFKIILSPNLPQHVICDEIRIRQSLTNLIGNSIKFTEKGSIELYIQEIYNSNNPTLVNLEFRVKDTGIGIPKNQQDLIFESFRQQSGQSNRKYGGTGLGLSITKKFVEMMNGKIELISDVGQGSEFIILLNDLIISHSEKVNDVIPENLSNENFDFQEAKILIVDDVKLNRDLLKTLLSKLNTKLFEAVNGEEAVFVTDKVKPNLILMDIRMPVMDGYKASHLIKTNQGSKHIPIIATTASIHASESNIKNTSFDYFLSKPINLKSLLLLMSKILSNHLIVEDLKIMEETNEPIEESISKELHYLLENDFYVEWETVKDSNDFEKISSFSDRLNLKAQHFECNLLKIYSEELNSSIENIDINQMNELLLNYTNLIKKFKIT